MLAAGQLAREEADAFVAQLHVGAQGVAVVTAAHFDRLEPGGLHVLDHDVLVIVLALDDEFDLGQIAALEDAEVFDGDPFVFLGLLAHGLTARARHVDLLVHFLQFVILPLDLDLEARLGDEVLQGEVREVGVEVERAGSLLAQFDGVFARFDRVAEEDELVVEREEVLGVDRDFLLLLAVQEHFEREFGFHFASGAQVVGERFDAEGRVAGGLPVGGVLAVVEQVLDQARGGFALRVHLGQKFEVIGLRFVLAAVPAPPVALVTQFQPGCLVFVILFQELFDVAAQHVALFHAVLLVEGEGQHGLGIDRQVVAVAVEEIAHFLVGGVRIGQDHIDEGVEVVGFLFLRFLVFGPVLDLLDFLGLVAFEPLDALFQYPRDDGDAVGCGHLEAVDHVGRGVGRGVLAPAGEPAPSAVGELHGGEALHAVLDHVAHGFFLEDGVAVVTLPLFGALGIVADFLRVEVGAFLLDRLEVQAHLLKDLLGHDGRQEAVERLLGAAVGVIHQVGERVHHRAGEGR